MELLGAVLRESGGRPGAALEAPPDATVEFVYSPALQGWTSAGKVAKRELRSCPTLMGVSNV